MADTPQDKAIGATTSVVGKTFRTRQLVPPGIGPAAAYADLDALGTLFPIMVPVSGIIQTALYYDLDDEGLQVDLWLFDAPVATQTDNAALTLADPDLVKTVGRIQFTSFADAANGQVAIATNLGLAYVAPQRRLYGQVQARGALNIAAGSEPRFTLIILADE